MTDTANAPERAFEFNTQGKAPSQKTKRIPPGLYTVSWKDGGTSEVAIGMTSNGDNWMAPTNWLRPAMVHSLEGGVWGSFERLERINATHCDELVAAARAEGAREAKIARLTEALKKYEDTLCEGFCGDCPWGYVDKNMLRDCGGCLARAALQENANE